MSTFQESARSVARGTGRKAEQAARRVLLAARLAIAALRGRCSVVEVVYGDPDYPRTRRFVGLVEEEEA